jgi:hypothetical protein
LVRLEPSYSQTPNSSKLRGTRRVLPRFPTRQYCLNNPACRKRSII